MRTVTSRLCCVALALATIASVVAPVGALSTGQSAPAATAPTADTVAAQPTVNGTTFGNVFVGDETPTFTLDGQGTAEWSVYDYWAKRVASGRAEAGDELSVPVEEPGYYELVVSTDGGTEEVAFAVLPPEEYATGTAFENAGESMFGMMPQPNKGGDYAYPIETIPLVRKSGAKHVRSGHQWRKVETEKGSFTEPPKFQAMEAAYRENDLRWLSPMASGNELYWDFETGPGPNSFTPPYRDAHYEAFARYVEYMVGNHPNLNAIEVWNEYNHEAFSHGPAGQDPAAYAKLTRVTAESARSQRRDIPVVGGALAGVGVPMDEWTHQLGENGAFEHMDAYSVHTYRAQSNPEENPRGLGSMEEEPQAFRSIVAEYTGGDGLPIWITEAGWRTRPSTNPGENLRPRGLGLNGGDSSLGVDELTQAQYIVRGHALSKAGGLERFYYYQFKDLPVQKAKTGIIRTGDSPMGAYAPKPAYVAYSILTRQLTGAEFVEREPVDGAFSYAYDRDGEPVRVLWTNTTRKTITLETDSPVTVTTIMGEERTYEPHGGEVYLTLGENPLYVSGSVSNVEAGAPVSFAANVPERTVPVPATFGVDGGAIGADSVTFDVDGETTTVDAGSGQASERVHLEADYRPVDPGVVSTVRIDGSAVGRLVSGTEGGTVSATLAERPTFDGVSALTYQFGNDGRVGGLYDVETYGGEQCWSVQSPEGGDNRRYLALGVDDTYAYDVDSPVTVTIRYYDAEPGHFGLRYDAQGPDNYETTFKTVDEPVQLDGSGNWETVEYRLEDAKLANRQNFRRDLRIGPVVGGEKSTAPICVSRVTVEHHDTADRVDTPQPGGELRWPASDSGGDTGTARDGSNAGDASTEEGPDGQVAGDEATDAADESTEAGSPGLGVLVALVAICLSGVIGRRRS
jgi:hypothetical protein